MTFAVGLAASHLLQSERHSAKRQRHCHSFLVAWQPADGQSPPPAFEILLGAATFRNKCGPHATF
jgi:hypothetical protein